MLFQQTPLDGAYIVELERLEDERGFFARSWCEIEAKKHDLPGTMVQSNVSFNRYKGTLRGLHFQTLPSTEGKLVRATKGSIFDVMVDLRPGSKSYLEYFSTVLSEKNHKAFYIPPGFAHGFQTLEDNTEVFYQMTDFYQPDCARGVRWNDPAFGIDWPDDKRLILDRDANYPDFVSESVAGLSALL